MEDLVPRDRIGDLGVEMHRRTGSTQYQKEAWHSTGRLQSGEENKGSGDGGKADDLSQQKNPSLWHSQLSSIFLLPLHSHLLKESFNLQVVWTINMCHRARKEIQVYWTRNSAPGLCQAGTWGIRLALSVSPSPSLLTKKYLGIASEEPGEILDPKCIK